MLNIFLGNRRTQNCEGTTRRDFVRVGALGAFGLSLPSFLAARAIGATVTKETPTAAPSAPRAKSVLLVYLGGGLSHHDTFDMKPDAPEEIRGKYKSISTNVSGLRIGELLPNMAKTMDKVCLVRSQSH